VRERLKAIKTNWLTQQEKLTALHEEAEKLRQQVQQLQAQAPRPTSEVVVEISSTVEVSDGCEEHQGFVELSVRQL
jgi:predicted nuclease with TOPRIM domain